MLNKIKEWAKALKADVMTLWYAYQDPLCPLLSKLLVGFIVAYALSPIDLIPDFIPIIGYLDEMILLPILITIAIKTIPNQVFTTAKAKATEHLQRKNPKPHFKPHLWLGALFILSIWVLIIWHHLVPIVLA